MKFLAFKQNNVEGLGVVDEGGVIHGRLSTDAAYPGSLDILIRKGGVEAAGAALSTAPVIDPANLVYLPPFASPDKVICIGLNYHTHRAEGGHSQVAEYPAIFGRFNSSLIGHQAPIIMPKVSDKLDYEGEMVAVIGKGGRHISKADALSHVAGYSVFNDATLRDYQRKTAQWTIGKNFDGTGAFGPYFVTADEVPAGGSELHIETRLNGQVLQTASTTDLIFGVAALVELLSEVMTLAPGDIIVTGTPGGVGGARKPPIWMKPGDVCEIEIERLGVLSNVIALEE